MTTITTRDKIHARHAEAAHSAAFEFVRAELQAESSVATIRSKPGSHAYVIAEAGLGSGDRPGLIEHVEAVVEAWEASRENGGYVEVPLVKAPAKPRSFISRHFGGPERTAYLAVLVGYLGGNVVDHLHGWRSIAVGITILVAGYSLAERAVKTAAKRRRVGL